MVHKDEMCALFKTLRSVDRIEILCGMFQLCVPQELRFIGSCLEDLIQKNYKLFYDAECIANDSKQLKDIARPLNKIDKEFCASLNTYLSLLHSDNTSCALSIFSILDELKNCFEAQLFQSSNDVLQHNDEFVEDIVLIFTMASYHPAFTITQRLRMYEVCKSLKDILKSDAGQNNKEFEPYFTGNDATQENQQSLPISINVRMLLEGDQAENEDIELEVIWTNGSQTSCLKSLFQLQNFQSQLFHAFPNLVELQNLNLILDPTSTDCSLHLMNLEKYFQNLLTLPKCVLNCQLVTDFLLSHSTDRFGRSISSPPTDPAVPLEAAINCSGKCYSNSEATEFHCDGSAYAIKVLPFVTKNSREKGDSKHSSSSANLSSSNFLLQTGASQRMPFPSPNLDPLVCSSSQGHSNSKWSHSDTKTKSVKSMAADRLTTQQGQRHRYHHHHHDRPQQQKDPKDAATPNVCNKSVEAMRDCEEISSQLLMTKLLPTQSEVGCHEDQVCHPICRSDHNSKHRHHFSEAQPKAKQNKTPQENPSSYYPASPDVLASMPVDNNLLTICTGPTVSGGKGRPILGAATNQNCKMAVDDIRILGIESKSSVAGVTLPRASSCGVILQQDRETQGLATADGGHQQQPNLANLHLPSSTYPPLDAYYSNMDSRISFVHVSPYSPFNQSRECSHSQALPIPNIPPTALASLINPSLVPPFSSNIPLNPPCTLCSSGQFSSYPGVWSHQLFFRNNGMLAPQFPHSAGVRQCPSGVYLQTQFDYFSYNSPGMMVTPPSSVATVPSTVGPPPPVPLLLTPPKTCCHNCGSSSHTVDLCDEPFMLSVGQPAQFKLKTFPKNESSSC